MVDSEIHQDYEIRQPRTKDRREEAGSVMRADETCEAILPDYCGWLIPVSRRLRYSVGVRPMFSLKAWLNTVNDR